ncbi:PAS domain-containing methyl-accepting chemotaxis protein [Blastopirellula sp. JC732]|uniref:PAS domain-containing methyl-accepting chemotaxis protein n=1 Tax=Blastopirellula sediminis TaxID=2894196 RepID=A0A9X1MPY1_9BACT|nr:PAS domain-containing methyl-accepting chemotaxis protein [Blastopirellula sediminis]MCC9605945.1 PAS domain-containing methyl-accepting chemotaxis protein [Blastopirellula sediminis]MCC9630756.1 PAS domain-containing methyl-accepting chemotaxis protein [Blastopirellula sediminis]
MASAVLEKPKTEKKTSSAAALRQELESLKAQVAAIGKSQAVIEFELDGTIVSANDNFLSAVGYSLDEIRGHHHRMFVPADVARSVEYQQFWDRLKKGQYDAGEYKRIGKGGKELWIQASYNPILDNAGRPVKVIKYASDITAEKMRNADYSGQIAAISKSQAVIEFNMDGTIIGANENFLTAVGYSLSEIAGKHHRMFVGEQHASSREYKEFWDRLNRGEYDSGEYKRFGKGAKEIWIQASYNPICDLSGKPYKVVKYASDITAQKLESANYSGQIEAIGKSQAVIEFNMDGTIIGANENFLKTLGYTQQEIVGQHHRMFVEGSYARSSEYQDFWNRLNRGQYDSGEYKRIGKGGKEIWIQASYNPIRDLNGNPYKVVKYAIDVTAQKLESANFSGQIEAISKSQAVIEFNMDGTIIGANDNFLAAVGYLRQEIVGQHHRMFVEDDYARSRDYQDFWNRLNRGEYDSGEYKRIGKGGKEIWIQASYNPILDLNGKPYKVVKYASDITQQVNLRHNMAQLIDDVIENANQFSESAGAVSETSQTLAQGAQTQSAAVEEISASTQELITSISGIRDRSSETNRLATETNQIAVEGGHAVTKSGEAMDLIKASSEQISEIIQVISEIASQTNLLALNAAIEAARAGEHGLGFAVVADEVRKLAERSSAAAKEISSLIKESTARVNNGVELSSQAGNALKKIVAAVESTSGKITEIATAADEQMNMANEVYGAIQQVAEVTEEATAASEELAASSEELGAQATALRDLVENFDASGK